MHLKNFLFSPMLALYGVQSSTGHVPTLLRFSRGMQQQQQHKVAGVTTALGLTLPPTFFRRASSWSMMPFEVVSTMTPNCTQWHETTPHQHVQQSPTVPEAGKQHRLHAQLPARRLPSQRSSEVLPRHAVLSQISSTSKLRTRMPFQQCACLQTAQWHKGRKWHTHQPGGQQTGDPSLKVSMLDIVPGRNDPALVQPGKAIWQYFQGCCCRRRAWPNRWEGHRGGTGQPLPCVSHLPLSSTTIFPAL